MHQLVGVGALVEAAMGLRDVIVVAPIALHPWRGLKLLAAPGAEIESGGEADFLFRLGISYLFPIHSFSFGPEFNVDLVDGEPTYIAGLGFGVGF